MHLPTSRIVLFVLVIGILLAGSVWTLLPFLSGTTYTLAKDWVERGQPETAPE